MPESISPSIPKMVGGDIVFYPNSFGFPPLNCIIYM